jgi:dipeptidyl aminopeptidase/acylaminoacyl peptidase
VRSSGECYTNVVHGFRTRLIAVAAIFIVSITLGMLVTQEGSRVPLRAEPLASTAGIYEFAWSPDSKSIAYVGPAGGGFDIFTIPTTGGQPRRLTATLRFKKQPRWSPNKQWIAFITQQDGGNSDLRVVSVDGQSMLTLTNTAAEEGDPVWSPDSTQIAFTQRIATQSSIMGVDLQSNVIRKLSDGPASNLRWSPDGKFIAFVADLLQPRDERRENEDVFVIPAEGGVPRLLTPGTPRFRDNSPDWAPDSRQIVYASEESGYSNLYTLDVSTGARRALTAGNAEILSPKWSPDGTTIAYVRHENSLFHVYGVSIEERTTLRISSTDGANAGYASANAGPPGMLEWSPDGKRIAFTHSDPARTSDIWIGAPEGGAPVQLTDSMPAELRRESRFVWPDRIAYRSFDGQEISALVYKPKGRRPSSGHPALLFFRDTLDGEHAFAWDPIIQFLASNGYLVFAPNVRGSGGYGRAYRDLIAGHGGDHDVRDALFGLDRLSSEGLIDTERLGVLGAGTGGFLTAATLIRGETRFKAAVSINAIVDTVTAASYPETSEWARYMIAANPLEAPMPYYERSLVNFVDKLRTPIVFLYAGHNPAAPFQQLQQFAVQAEVKGRWYDYRVFENESGEWRTWRAANMRFALESMEMVFEKFLMGREREIRLTRNR